MSSKCFLLNLKFILVTVSSQVMEILRSEITSWGSYGVVDRSQWSFYRQPCAYLLKMTLFVPPKENLVVIRNWYSIEKFSMSFINNAGFRWFCFTSLCDWFRKLASLSQPIRYNANTNHDLVAAISRSLLLFPWTRVTYAGHVSHKNLVYSPTNK